MSLTAVWRRRFDGKTYKLHFSYPNKLAAKQEAKRMAAKASKKFRYRIIPARGSSRRSTNYALYVYTG